MDRASPSLILKEISSSTVLFVNDFFIFEIFIIVLFLPIYNQ